MSDYHIHRKDINPRPIVEMMNDNTVRITLLIYKSFGGLFYLHDLAQKPNIIMEVDREIIIESYPGYAL